MDDMVRVMKRAAVDAVLATKPVGVAFGRVASASPLRVNVEQKMTLGKTQLALSRSAAQGGLSAGDEVVLLRMQGGQKYVVLDVLV